MLYLAYGSNLSRARMGRRCPAARPLWSVTVPGWALRFERVATIVPHPRACLAGALYRLTPECQRTLDRVEGVAEGRYRRTALMLPDGEGGPRPVLTYIKIDARHGPPTQAYLAHVVAGFQDWGLDQHTLWAAVAAVEDSA